MPVHAVHVLLLVIDDEVLHLVDTMLLWVGHRVVQSFLVGILIHVMDDDVGG